QSFPAAHQIRIRVSLTAKYVVYDRGIQVEASELRGEESRTYNSGSRADQVRTHVRRECVRIPSLRIQFGGNDRSEIRNFLRDARVEGPARVQMIMSGEVNKLSGVHGSQKADALEYLRFDKFRIKSFGELQVRIDPLRLQIRRRESRFLEVPCIHRALSATQFDHDSIPGGSQRIHFALLSENSKRSDHRAGNGACSRQAEPFQHLTPV